MKMQLYQGRPVDMTGRQDKEKRVYELLDRLINFLHRRLSVKIYFYATRRKRNFIC